MAVFLSTGFEFDDSSSSTANDTTETPTTTTVVAPTLSPSAAPSVPRTRAPAVPTVRACNGLVSLCDIPVNEILFGTLHNANSDQETAVFGQNQNQGLELALQAGMRGINMDFGICLGDNDEPQLSLVHGTCLLGFSEPTEKLTKIHRFLGENPNEVVIMPLEINDNTGGPVVLQDIFNVMQGVQDSNGIRMTQRLYQHDGSENWPTLGDLIDLDQRILLFVYNYQDTNGLPLGFHDWFTWAAETEFQFDNVQELTEDTQRACTITRGGSGHRSFFGVNVFSGLLPSVESAVILNQADFLRQHLEACALQNNNLQPNLVLVDFWSQGDVVDMVQSWNADL